MPMLEATAAMNKHNTWECRICILEPMDSHSRLKLCLCIGFVVSSITILVSSEFPSQEHVALVLFQ